ncbi:MAG: hypothetical protein ABJE95_07140 [Byssovorax sp.]
MGLQMPSYLIYHPARESRLFGATRVYFDKIKGNQDPYVWCDSFLHSYCHITELSKQERGDINFWVTGDQFPEFDVLLCDLVFVVRDTFFWQSNNEIDVTDPIVDSLNAYQDHYQWATHSHALKRRKRRTIKADPARSFQPQASDGTLIDVLPHLIGAGICKKMIRSSLKKGFASKPMKIDENISMSLEQLLTSSASVMLRGDCLRAIRDDDPGLASPPPRTKDDAGLGVPQKNHARRTKGSNR